MVSGYAPLYSPSLMSENWEGGMKGGMVRGKCGCWNKEGVESLVNIQPVACCRAI